MAFFHLSSLSIYHSHTQQIGDFALTLHKQPLDTLACLGLATTLCLPALLPPNTYHPLLETLLPSAAPAGDVQSHAALKCVRALMKGRPRALRTPRNHPLNSLPTLLSCTPSTATAPASACASRAWSP